MAHYLPESPNNGVAQTYMLIASRHGQTYGASRGGGGWWWYLYLASVEWMGIMRLSYTNMIIRFHLMDR